jgi:glycosyltransferase involved in cell wall biosynthesis
MLGRNPGHVTTQGQIVADLFSAEGYHVTSVSSKLNRAGRMSEIVATLIRGFKLYDAVVLETFSGLSFVMADVVSLMCKLLNLPLVMFLHGGNLPAFSRKHPRWVRSVLNRANKLIAPSEFIAAKFRDLGYDVAVIPNVIEIDDYPFHEREIVRPRLIWMRSFHEVYNPQMAVRVLAGLRKIMPDATLTMAGADKGLLAETEALAAELGSSSSTRFVGFLDHAGKIDEFSKADIYINTNHIDNMPVSVLEARALGLPVVATDVGGLSYLVTHGEDGLLVPDDNCEAMIAAVRELVENPGLAHRLSLRGREVVKASDWANVRAKWEAMFSELFAERREPAVAKEHL